MFNHGLRLYENWKRFNQYLRLHELAYEGIQIFSITYVLTQYGVNWTLCVGPSMLPTLREEGDLVLIDRFSHTILQKRYKKDDVVICICPYDPKKTICNSNTLHFLFQKSQNNT